MIVDTSPILAIYFNEPMGAWCLDQLRNAKNPKMSTVNLAECLIRIRDKHPDKADLMQQRLLAGEIEFIAPTTDHAILVARARVMYPLNFGDCFAYALAKTESLPLLTLDQDFRNADISVLLPPTP